MKPTLPATDRLRAASLEWAGDSLEGAVFKALADMTDEFKQSVAGMQGLDLAKIEAMHNRAAKSCLQDAAKTFVRTRNWKATAMIAHAVAFALMAVGAGGYLVGRQSPSPLVAEWVKASSNDKCSIQLRTAP